MAQAPAPAQVGVARATEDDVRVARRHEPSARLTWTVVGCLAVLAGVLALVVASNVYPYGTRNRDDQAYVVQARLLEDGHLTFSRSQQSEFFRPNMTGVRGDKLVYVYTPAWAAVLGSSDFVFGTMRPALFVTAALSVAAVALFAGELWRDRRTALVAAFLFAFSPMFVSQSGTYLSYELSVLLYFGFAGLLLAGLRRQSRVMLVASGVVLGLAVFARPFDALLFALPVLVYLLVVSRRDMRSLAAPAGWLLLGALPLVALTAVLNQHLMGSPLSFPQNVAGSLNKFGFGDRLGIHDPGTRAALPIHFTLGKSWSALWKDVRLMPRWVFGSYVAVALAIFSMVRRRRDPRAWLLFAFVVVFPFGYLFWWGNYSATFVFRLELGLGPYYYFPAIAAIGLLAADGIILLLDALARVTARAAAFGLLGGLALLMVAVTAIGMRYPLKDASRLRRQERAALARVAPVPRNGLLFLTQDQIGNPYPELVNAPDLSNSPLYALDRVDRNLALIDRYPSKPPYALRYSFGYDVDIFKHRPRPKLVAVHVVPAFERPVTATFHTPSPKRYVIAYVRQGDRVVSRVLDTAAVPGRSYAASWDVKSPAAGSSGTGGFVVTPTSGDAYAVGFATSNTPSLAGADRYEYRWAFSARSAGPMRVAEPAAPYRDLVFPNNVDVWVMEDVSPVLTVSGAGSPR